MTNDNTRDDGKAASEKWYTFTFPKKQPALIYYTVTCSVCKGEDIECSGCENRRRWQVEEKAVW